MRSAVYPTGINLINTLAALKFFKPAMVIKKNLCLAFYSLCLLFERKKTIEFLLNKLPKNERLHHKKIFEKIFKEGKSAAVFPLRAIWTETDEESQHPPVLFGCSIPKKKIPGAVKRNKLKRRIKEAYRLNKKDIIEYLFEKNVQIAVVFIYLDKKETDYQTIETKLKHLLKIIKETY